MKYIKIYRLRLIYSIWAGFLLSACTTTEPLPPVPKIESVIKIDRLWKLHTNPDKYSNFVPQLGINQVVDADANAIKLIDVNNGRILTQIKMQDRKIIAGIGAQNMLFIVASLKGKLYAYDKNGQLLWETQASNEIIAPPVITPSGQVIVRTIDGRITAYAQQNGQQNWQFVRSTPPLSIRNYAPITVDKGLIFAGLANGQLISLVEENGSLVWETPVALPRGKTELERAVDVLSRPLIIDNQVCAVSYQGRIGCFDIENGSLLWTHEMSSTADLATDGNRLFGVTTSGQILAFNVRNGNIIWQCNDLKGRKLGAPAVFEEHLILGDIEGYIYLLNKHSGAIESMKRIARSMIRQQPLIYNQHAIVKTSRGDLVALKKIDSIK